MSSVQILESSLRKVLQKKIIHDQRQLPFNQQLVSMVLFVFF